MRTLTPFLGHEIDTGSDTIKRGDVMRLNLVFFP